jgi:uncharacterized protein YdiU (UPF0061 family)
VIADFSREFDEHWLAGMRRKLGLFNQEDGDLALIRALLDAMQRGGADFTVTFRRLCAAAEGVAGDAAMDGMFADPADIRQWSQGWRARLAREPQPESERAASMRLVNPAVIPRNHRIEAMIAAAVERGDFAPFRTLMDVLAHPYEDSDSGAPFAVPPLPEERVLQTFCGT